MLMLEQDYVLSDEYFPDAEEYSLDFDAGETLNGKTIWTPDRIAAHITRTNTSWLTTGKQSDTNQDVINFAFFNTQAEVAANGYTYTLGSINYGLNEFFGFSPFTQAQRVATREAMGYWDDVVNVTFAETSADQGDINFGNLTNRPGTQAYARLPSASVSSNAEVNKQAYDIVGDVWVTATTPSNFQLDERLYGMNK